MKHILPFLKPYRGRIALAMALVGVATICDLLLPALMSDILNNGIRGRDFPYILRCCAWMLLVASVGLATLILGRKLSADVVAGFNGDMRTAIFRLVNRMHFEEFNALGIPGLPPVRELFPLCGAFVNMEYSLPNGQRVKLLKDTDIYLGCQVEKPGSTRCYGLAADAQHLLVCEYGENGSDPEIVVYQKRMCY